MKPSTLNRDKYKIMKQRNWGVDVSKASRDFRILPVSLADGISESIRWYREEGLDLKIFMNCRMDSGE